MAVLKCTEDIIKRGANTIRFLSADGVQKANSGHPGMPMGMADVAFILWTHFLKFNPMVPDWVNRDRFVLSAGHGSMLLYSMLYLCGYDVTIEDLKSFRQWGSKTPGHPEYWCLPGVETTTGPLGQGFANGIGMAIASKIVAERFNTPEYNVFGDHKVYAIVSDGDIMEGVACEAASLAGHLGLGNIIYIYDDNRITIEGKTDLTFSENVHKRFEAYGWQVLNADAYDYQGFINAVEAAINENDKPSIIITKSHIGYGSPNKQDNAEVHGAPLGEEELKLSKRNMGWYEDKEFFVPEDIKELFNERVKELTEEYKKWEIKFNEWKSKYPELYREWLKFVNKEVPDNLEKELLEVVKDASDATRKLSGKVIQKAADLVPNLVGGSADLAPSTNTYMRAYESISQGNFRGRNFHFGIREHAMGSILNGVSLYGGFIPFGATFLVFSDYMRPPIRLAAMMETQVIYVFTHDSIFIGEDGPTHQPIEQIASLRLIPNLIDFRPADWVEVAMAWAYAIRRKDGPTALFLTRQKVPALERDSNFSPDDVLKGGYILSNSKKEVPDVVIIGTGSEVNVAVEAKRILDEKGLDVRVISMPSVKLFKQQDDNYKKCLIPSDSKVVVVEAGVTSLWKDITDSSTMVIGIDRFGASAPYKVLAEKFGFTRESVAQKILNWLSK
ncbi:MAG: transketolase [Candidatus Marinimicrobia bacterium]|nr:transketolase [Candidatus Neomarinimicrobiota bacterium]